MMIKDPDGQAVQWEGVFEGYARKLASTAQGPIRWVMTPEDLLHEFAVKFLTLRKRRPDAPPAQLMAAFKVTCRNFLTDRREWLERRLSSGELSTHRDWWGPNDREAPLVRQDVPCSAARVVDLVAISLAIEEAPAIVREALLGEHVPLGVLRRAVAVWFCRNDLGVGRTSTSGGI